MSMINDYNYKFFLPEAPVVVPITIAIDAAPNNNKRAEYNPGEVSIEPVNENWYIAYRREGKERRTFHVPTPWGNIYEWANSLSDSQLEAAIQMFYDKWNFKTDSNKTDRRCLDVALEERSRRLGPNSTFHPVIFAKEMGDDENVYVKDNFVSVTDDKD